MPYAAPHVAACGLWSLLREEKNSLEVSIAPFEGLDHIRLGLECVAISAHRSLHGRSPRINFGRMPIGFSKSSNYSLKLVGRGKVFRGCAVSEIYDYHSASIPPATSRGGEPSDQDWCGHNWSAWKSAEASVHGLRPSVTGLYRIRSAASDSLLYVGQGRVSSRIGAHIKKTAAPDTPQGRVFSGAGELECSFVELPEFNGHQLLELECDLIASHFVRFGRPPLAQFNARGSGDE